MAIQHRRGNYADFDPTKMVAGEPAVVLGGDPTSSDGKAAYISFGPGLVKKLATAEDMRDEIYNQTQNIIQDIEEGVADDVEQAESAAQRAETAAAQFEIDATLTQQGKPADAKKVGDEISDLKADLSEITEESGNEVDRTNFVKLDGYYIDLQEPHRINTSSNVSIMYVACLPDAIYKISKIQSKRFQAAYTNVIPANGVSTYGYIRDDNATNITIETGNDAAYLVVYYKHSSDTLSESEIYESITIEYNLTTSAVDSTARNEISVINGNIGDLNGLETETKNDLVSAINEAAKSGFSDAAKDALLACIAHIGAWSDGNAEEYYNDLYNSLYPESPIEQWTLNWDYIKGMPSDNGLDVQNGNQQNSITMTNDGVLISVANVSSNTVRVRYTDGMDTKLYSSCVIETEFRIDSYGKASDTPYGWGIRYQAGLGYENPTSYPGIQITFSGNATKFRNATPSWEALQNVSPLSTGRFYKVRLEQDMTEGKLYVDEALVTTIPMSGMSEKVSVPAFTITEDVTATLKSFKIRIEE